MPFCLRFNSPKKKNNLECVEDILTQSAYIDFGDKYGLNLTSEFILSFIWRVPLKVTVQHRWKTIETDRSDSVKGYNGCLIEPVNALVLKPLKSDWHLISSYNITTESHINVMRIKEMITN